MNATNLVHKNIFYNNRSFNNVNNVNNFIKNNMIIIDTKTQILNKKITHDIIEINNRKKYLFIDKIINY